MLSCPLTDSLHSQDPGTKLSDFGILARKITKLSRYLLNTALIIFANIEIINYYYLGKNVMSRNL